MRAKIDFKKIKSFVVFLTPALILILLFSRINIPEFIEHLKRTDVLVLLIGAIVFIFTDIFLCSLQWSKILHILGCQISLKEVLYIRMASRPARSLLPSRGGDLVKCLYLKKQKELPISFGVSSLFFQLALNLLVLLLIISIAYVFFFRPGYLILFFPAVILLYFLSVMSFEFMRKVILFIAKKINTKFYNSLEILFEIYKKLQLKDLAAIFLYSVIMWAGELMVFVIIFKAVGLNIPFYAVLIFVPLIIIASSIPVTISGLGIRETVMVFFFSRFGSAEEILSSGVLVSFVQVILPIAFSLFFVKSFLRRLFDVREANS